MTTILSVAAELLVGENTSKGEKFNIWQKKNDWFAKKVIPDLRKLIEQFLFRQDEKIPKQPLV